MEQIINSKVCCKCNIEKKINEFYKDKTYSDGYRNDCKSCKKQYFQDNKEQVYKYVKSYMKNKRKECNLFVTKYNISCGMRNALKKVLKNKNTNNLSKWEKTLGYSGIELKEHLEKQFEPWMNWDNWGRRTINGDEQIWQIDHIITLSTAKTAEEIIYLWRLENIRPLQAKLNSSRRCK